MSHNSAAGCTYTYTTARQSPQDLDERARSTSSKQGDTSRTTAGSQAQLILLPFRRRYQDLSCLPCLCYARSRARPGHVQRSSTPLPLCYSRAAPLVCVESLAAFVAPLCPKKLAMTSGEASSSPPSPPLIYTPHTTQSLMLLFRSTLTT